MDPQLSKAIRQAALGEKVQKAGVLTADDDLFTSDAVGEIYLLSGDAGAVVNGADAPTLKVGQLAGTPLTPLVFGLGNGALGSLTIERPQTGADTGEVLGRRSS